ncbi:motility associated factor glycosyltransferase family protein [Campylobacter jejuni]|uniref:Motility associated factor glycosyltransferase family protein n=1 Tax=Campylobacter jejuni TaxID=197 RepID=A0AAW5EFH1_CAMJU|nr:motility associated factor glycosyltransferase family protein [Campylobacter jejuni]EAK4323595.1 motility associated factor glycosyltransferase family protein [Campylobacter jejuni]ECL2449855.1 motility associated factor glycosyltransferase family protein [Campylobacter jejuni]MCE3577484.1 motility associated factor glycosyltransferase family protein [Campylobacter jejuni]MCE4859819.1 motility associated factor glycosyltransferase family protein [Campylobacter jejuni]MCH3835096.1 motility a
MTILEKNIQALLSGVNEPLGNKLLNFIQNKTCSRFNIDENLNIYDKTHNVFMYENLEEEINFFYQSILEKTHRYPFACIYGIGNALLIKNLSKHYKHLFVFESEIELFILALSTLDLSEELCSGKIYLVDIEEERVDMQLRILFDQNDVFLWLNLYEMFINNNFYKKYYYEEILNADKIIHENINLVIRNLEPDSKISLSCYENFYKNIPLMLKNIPFKRIIDERKGLFESCIVVCAGPSLQKQIPLLKKYQENFVIFCVDGAYPLLVKHNITPDYVLNLDFEEYPLEFFKEVNPENKTLFILAASTHPSVVDYLYEKQIPLSIALSNNLPCQNLHINDFGYLEFGTHVGHACYTLAIALKFKNIIIIGQDLSFDKQGNSHFDSFDLGSDIDTTLNIPTLKTVAYGGLGEVLTHLAWDDYRKKLEDLFARNSQVNFLNATEGGARIEFTKEINFELCCKKFKNLNNKLKKYPPKTLTANRSVKILNKILETFKEEKQNALFCLEHAMRLNDVLKMILASDKKLPLDFLKNTYESVSNFESFLEINSLLNDGVLKGVIFHKGKLLSEVVISKIEDEKEYLLMYLKSYKQWLEIFIFRLQLKCDIYNFLV